MKSKRIRLRKHIGDNFQKSNEITPCHVTKYNFVDLTSKGEYTKDVSNSAELYENEFWRNSCKNGNFTANCQEGGAVCAMSGDLTTRIHTLTYSSIKTEKLGPIQPYTDTESQ